ncbi:MAG: C39 family peptidase [bacterium]
MLVGLTIVCVITWLVSGFASADEIQTVATKLMERVAQYSIRHPDQPGSRTEWIDGWAGTPFLIRTYPEATHAYYVVPVFNSSDKITSLIGIDAETSEWQWYTRQYTYDTFPPVCRADALAAMEHSLQKRGITAQLSPPILISTPDMRMYWWSVVYPPGEGVREVFVCSNNSQRVYTDLERKEALNKKGDPKGSSASYKPKRSKLIHHNLPDAHDITDLPYHSQETDWYCGEAALQMIFDYYGPLISQEDIGDVADESAGSGTYPDNLRRAAHFSSWSTAVQNPDLRGYPERDLGYGAFEYEWSYSSQYPNRYTDLKHLVSQDFPVLILAQNHYLVVKGYNDSLDVFMVHDPWPSYGPDVSVRQSFLVDHRWVGSDRWGLFVSPWSVDVDAPDLVVQDGKFTVDVTVTYVAPPPFGDEYYPLSVPLASIILPSRFTLAGGIPTKGLPSLLVPGASEKVSWRVKALDRVSPRDTIAVSVRGFIRGRSRSYFLLYQDWIGGVGLGYAGHSDQCFPVR